MIQSGLIGGMVLLTAVTLPSATAAVTGKHHLAGKIQSIDGC